MSYLRNGSIALGCMLLSLACDGRDVNLRDSEAEAGQDSSRGGSNLENESGAPNAENEAGGTAPGSGGLEEAGGAGLGGNLPKGGAGQGGAANGGRGGMGLGGAANGGVSLGGAAPDRGGAGVGGGIGGNSAKGGANTGGAAGEAERGGSGQGGSTEARGGDDTGTGGIDTGTGGIDTGTGGSGGGCPIVPPCNWCMGTPITDENGCTIDWVCKNGKRACSTMSCPAEPCEEGEICDETDGLCWPEGGMGGAGGGGNSAGGAGGTECPSAPSCDAPLRLGTSNGIHPDGCIHDFCCTNVRLVPNSTRMLWLDGKVTMVVPTEMEVVSYGVTPIYYEMYGEARLAGGTGEGCEFGGEQLYCTVTQVPEQLTCDQAFELELEYAWSTVGCYADSDNLSLTETLSASLECVSCPANQPTELSPVDDLPPGTVCDYGETTCTAEMSLDEGLRWRCKRG